MTEASFAAEHFASDSQSVSVANDRTRWPFRQWLTLATTAYLGIPVFIFLWGWLKPVWAAPCIACGMFTMTATIFCKGTIPASTNNETIIKPWQALLFLVGLAMIVCISGPGGFGVQNWDWLKHNAILRDLVDKPWPVVYTTAKGEVGLNYYVAYYLPAAVVGKIAGWEAANTAICIWTVSGCFLAGLWATLLSGARWWLALAVLILFSGMDFLGISLWRNFQEPHDWINNFDAEWWPGLWTLPSNLTLIAYAPNQAIAGWLCSALLMDGFRNRPEAYPLGGTLVFSILWSPFITIGLAAIAGIWLLSRRVNLVVWFKAQWRPYNLAAFPLAMVLVLYFLSRYVPYEIPDSLYPSKHIIDMGAFYFAPAHSGPGAFFAAYFLTVLLEFGPLALLIFLTLRKSPGTDRILLGAALVVLLVVPWFHYGRFNDLVMRISIPALFVLQVTALRTLSKPSVAESVNGKRRLQYAIFFVLALGALYPINMLRITANRIAERSWQVVSIPKHDQLPDLFEQQRRFRKRLFSIGQYIGSVNSRFYRTFARDIPSLESSEQTERLESSSY